MKRNICPMKLNYIMTRVKTLSANIIYFNNHCNQKTYQLWVKRPTNILN